MRLLAIGFTQGMKSYSRAISGVSIPMSNDGYEEVIGRVPETYQDLGAGHIVSPTTRDDFRIRSKPKDNAAEILSRF
jgi:hypothetical protein